MQDFEDILEMFEDYKRDPRPMDQEPRNMYANGQLVSNTVDGSRPGYKGDKSTDKVLLERLQAYNEKSYSIKEVAKQSKDVVDAASIGKIWSTL